MGLGAGVVAAHSYAQRSALVAVHAELLRELAGHALAGEHERRAVLTGALSAVRPVTPTTRPALSQAGAR